MPEFAPVISGIALVVSVIVFVDNRLRAQEASRLARVPMLAFTWEPPSGWTLTNIGSGPALDVVIVQRTDDQWKLPLRMPELAVHDSDVVPVGWIRWEENPTLAARYRSITGERYMTKTSHDWSQHARGWGDMPDALWENVEPHWRYPVDVPPDAEPRHRERDQPDRAIRNRGKRRGMGGSRPRILVSYRRADRASFSPFMDVLSARFGDSFFRDYDFDASGTGPAAVIDRVLGSVNVLVVLIGRAWQEPGGDGQRRLDDPNDSVRQEIEGALRRGIAIVPVLADGARMPTTQELPASLAPFASLQPLRLRYERAVDDVAQLISRIS